MLNPLILLSYFSVAYLNGVQVVAGSNPVTPIEIKPCKSLLFNGLQGFFVLYSKLKPILLIPP